MKARDSTRLSDIKALQGAIEQAYLDNSNYPNRGTAFTGAVASYMTRLPHDPRGGVVINGTAMDYLYQSFDLTGNNATNAQRYEISVGFEGTGSAIPTITNDGGLDNVRHEVGVQNTGTNDIDTSRTAATNTYTALQCVAATGAPAACSNTRWTLIK